METPELTPEEQAAVEQLRKAVAALPATLYLGIEEYWDDDDGPGLRVWKPEHRGSIAAHQVAHVTCRVGGA